MVTGDERRGEEAWEGRQRKSEPPHFSKRFDAPARGMTLMI